MADKVLGDDARLQAIRRVARDIEMSYAALAALEKLHENDEDVDFGAAWAASRKQTVKAIEALIAAQCGVADAECQQALSHQALAEQRAASAEQAREREGAIRDAAVKLQDKLLEENRTLRERAASAEARLRALQKENDALKKEKDEWSQR